ncbi:hypothetical protein [Oceanobacillus senegalensis]|uniref:hypothetical protein n=1 Tax=Oceanobacillus senegalensis TaxID=1936063 RepID=UPI000A313B69|nr:hypothetical protein [Oceanobacillus senegalensis]
MIWTGTIIISITLIIALIATINILKREENKANERGGDAAEELKRSHEYETKSLSSNIKNLLWIYAVVIILSIIALAFYIF